MIGSIILLIKQFDPFYIFVIFCISRSLLFPQFVICVNQKRVINYPTIIHFIYRQHHLNLFILIFGVLPPFLLVVSNIVSISMTILANSHGSISYMIVLIFTAFFIFQTHVKCLIDTKTKCVQSNQGGEYQKLHNQFFTKMGITHLVSCPHTHQ